MSVTDEGIGDAPDRGERLFEMFAQEPGDHHHGGLGIGLFRVRAIAERHGGTATGASAGPGLGSTFTLRVPVTAAESRAAVAQKAHLEYRRRRRRILVADDHRDSARMLELLLVKPVQ